MTVSNKEGILNKRKAAFSTRNMLVIMVSILPFVDTLNGFYRNIPISIIYKFALCIFLFVNCAGKSSSFSKKRFTIIVLSGLYIFLSVGINLGLGGTMWSVEFPIKLFSNIVLFYFVEENIRINRLYADDIYSMLNNGSWIFIGCYLIPYVLGVGNRVYAGDIGYKAFFIAQNELGLLIIVFTFFVTYKLSKKITAKDVVCLALLFLCGMLLNTKTTIAACIIAIIMWLLPVLKRRNLVTKIATVVVIIVGFILLRNVLINSINQAMLRFTTLQTKYYDNSLITSILSGRNYLLKNAWQYLLSEHTVLRMIIGNGFCAPDLIEMDFFDIFFYLGIIGFIAVVWFVVKQGKKIARNAKREDKTIKMVSYLVIVLQMVIAGHVLMMSMAGCYFVFFVSFLIYYNTKLQH